MTSKALVVALAISLGLTATACDKIKRRLGGAKPGGQVVATVNGEEITALELRGELGGFNSTDPKVMQAARQQALQQIIMRNILAKKAQEKKMDKTVDYNLQVRRGSKTLLAQMYEGSLVQDLAPPTRAEAEQYISKHPEQFAQRRLFILDQVIAPAGSLPKDKLLALKTLEEVKNFLDAQQIPYQENSAAIDTLTANPASVDEIAKMPPGEVFIIPQGGVAFSFNRVAQVRSVPFKGQLAVNFALDMLRKIQLQDLVRTRVANMRIAAEPTIVYSPGYKPPQGPSLPPASAGAPATFKPKQ